MSNRYYKHIFRVTRLQLKSGYLKEEPIEYGIMKRYPPMNRGAIPKRMKLIDHDIPYVKLYKKAIQKNPLYADDRIFPAYWQYEPSALTLAKKQYQHMQAGLDEETAYKKAVDFVDELEDNAYQNLSELIEKINSSGAKVSILNDSDTKETIDLWHIRLSKTPYEKLELADQGELDHFVQTKILKWNEIERERRMRDPMFVLKFEKIRGAIFPEISKFYDDNMGVNRPNLEESVKDMVGESQVSLWRTTHSFYYEDYEKYFQMVKENQQIDTWNPSISKQFANWILDTLAFHIVLERNNSDQIEAYLCNLLKQFFPMFRKSYQGNTSQISFPDKLTFRTSLYENQIGYKNEEGKLYVLRFYHIPRIFFTQKEGESDDNFALPFDTKKFLGGTKALKKISENAKTK